MKFYCCFNVMRSIMFTHNKISFCPKQNKLPVIEKYNGDLNYIKTFLEARKKHIDNCKNGNVPQRCLQCPNVEYKEWDEEIGIEHIGVANRTNCPCNCIYCTESKGDTEKRNNINQIKNWDITKVLQELENAKLLRKSGWILIAGGECAIYPKEELELLNAFAKRNNFTIIYATSGIIYSDIIEQALIKNKAKILISPDSGTKEMYEKIKRRNTFDIVWNNIDKYNNAAKNNPDAVVSLKYIILEGINDTIEEFSKFIQMCDEHNIQDIEIAVEYFKYSDITNYTISKSLQGMLSYINSLNDKRIHYEFRLAYNKETSGREYSPVIEQYLMKSIVNLKVIIFAGKELTYKSLTDSDKYNDIWKNIKSYSDILVKYGNRLSSINLEYKFILGKNDSKNEIEEFLDRCKENNLNNITFGLFNNSYKNTDPLTNLIETLEFLFSQDYEFKFSDELEQIAQTHNLKKNI